MSKLNVTKGEWYIPHFVKDDVTCNCPWILNEGYVGSIATINWSKNKSIEEGDSPPLEEAKANATLICDAANTYNKTGFTPSELANQVEEMREALNELMYCCETYNVPRTEQIIQGDYILTKYPNK